MKKRFRRFLTTVLVSIMLVTTTVMPVCAATDTTMTDITTTYASSTSSAYTMAMMQSDLQYLQKTYPDKISYSELGKSVNGQPVYQIILGNSKAEHAYFIQSSMHAREYINTQIIMKMVEYYATQDLKNTCFYILPMVNPDGIAMCQAGKTSYKANANGVDINRNFPVGWDDIPAEPAVGQYKGESPLSEPEAVILKNAVSQRTFELNINYHSKGNAIYYTSLWAPEAVQTKCTEYANLASSITGFTSIKCTSASEGATFADYVVSNLNLPYITIESGSSGCPVSQSEFSTLYNKNVPVWAALIK